MLLSKTCFHASLSIAFTVETQSQNWIGKQSAMRSSMGYEALNILQPKPNEWLLKLRLPGKIHVGYQCHPTDGRSVPER